MATSADYRITTTDQLRTIMGTPGRMTGLKVLKALDQPATDFIRQSPFLVLSTADTDGNQDASPKGDGPGFRPDRRRSHPLYPRPQRQQASVRS